MGRSKRLLGLSFLLNLFLAPLAVAQTDEAPLKQLWRGADGQPLPFTSEDEVLQFLETAPIAASEPISQGINHSRKVLLEMDGLRAHAAFRSVHVDRLKRREVRGVPRLRLRDDCIFEVAAYRLSRLLGTGNVPPTVVRTIDGRQGTLQLWVEEAIPEAERRRRKQRPPDPIAWSRQLQVKAIFDHLIFNDDRNLNNWLIDRDWKVWLIDHTRTFDAVPRFLIPGRIYWCPRMVWERLLNLDAGTIRREMQNYLDGGQIDALLERRRLLVDHLQNLITRKGEESVLYE